METPDFNRLFDLDEINDLLDNCRDPYKKEIGDRVVIMDFSSCSQMNGMELDWDDTDTMNFNYMTEFIVIETGQKHVHDAFYKKYRQDVVIVNTLTNKKFRINSGHLKLN